MAKIYIIQPGDTMSGIASRHSTSLNALLSINPHIEQPDVIYVGQSINVPDQIGSDAAAGIVENDASAAGYWFTIAQGELNETEIPGPVHNPRIVEYHLTTSLKASDDETPWCSSFVNWCMERSGREGTDSAAARSWMKWGEKLEQPRKGCVVVFSRPPSPWSGHVGFFDRMQGSHILVLGGNQRNAVNYTSYSTSRLLGYRWPTA